MSARRRRPPRERVPRAEDERELFGAAVEALGPAAVRSALAEKAAVEREPSRRSRTRRPGDRNAGPAATLDLHGCDRVTALERLSRFLAAQPRGSAVLVVHGRGEGVLAAAVRSQLDRDPRVLRHEAAPPRLGGDGARVVTLV